MDNRIYEYVKNLEDSLGRLSEEEKKSTLFYYEEYLQDALDSGKDLDEVLNHLGSPAEIGELVLAENAMIEAQKKPGFMTFNKAMRNIFYGVTSPIGIVMRVLFLLVAYSLFIALVSGALLSALASLVFPGILFYEVFNIPASYRAEFTGSLGMALFSFGFCFILALGLWKLSRGLIKRAARTLGQMLPKKKTQEPTEEASAHRVKKQGFRRLIPGISLAIMVGGLFISLASGLPVKLFTIFNSMKPQETHLSTYEYAVGDIDRISIDTAHSCIRIIREDRGDGKVVLAYEQPDWLHHQANLKDGLLAFTEKSNGRLPLFDLVSLHETRNEVRLYLPEGFEPERIQLQSKGGFVFIDDVIENIDVKTFSGSIQLTVSDNQTPFKLKAWTKTGKIETNTIDGGSHTGTELTVDQPNAAKTMEFTTSQGNVVLQRD